MTTKLLNYQPTFTAAGTLHVPMPRHSQSSANHKTDRRTKDLKLATGTSPASNPKGNVLYDQCVLDIS